MASPATSEGGRPRIAIVGLGLIGGSLALALNKVAALIGVDTDADTRRLATDAGIQCSDQLTDAVDHADIVVIAVPLAATIGTLSDLAGAMLARHRYPLVTDVSSVKLPIDLAAAQCLPPQAQYVGGHPMAGTEGGGFADASPGMFQGCAWPITIDDRSSLRGVARVCDMIQLVGGHAIPITAPDHDRSVGMVSHLPHLLATTLLRLVCESEEGGLTLRLAAGSFRDATRVATRNPEFVASMCQLNRTNVLASLDDMLEALHRFRDTIDVATSLDDLADYVRRPALDRLAVLESGWVSMSVMIPGDDGAIWRRTLLDIGEGGGVLEGIDDLGGRFRMRARLPVVQ